MRLSDDKIAENWFDLDFTEPEEAVNEVVLEKDLYNKLVQDGFTFTDKPDGIGAAYIMPDGKFLFLEQNRKFFTTNKVTHGSLDFYLIEKGYIQQTDASRVLCQTDNAVRINDGTNFAFETLIGLPKYKLTAEQEESLEIWLYNNMNNKKYFVSVGNDLVSEVFRRYDLRVQSSEEIVNKIKSYYNNGVLREACDIKEGK